jgi:molybdopterin-guanine dinucleotide biosynthesis protein A
MGTDKAFIEIDGRALALRVADALAAAGAALSSRSAATSIG